MVQGGSEAPIKVAVFISDQSAHYTGGGFTFEEDVLRGFLTMAGQSKHHFVLLCPVEAATALAKRVAAPNVSVHPISHSWTTRALSAIYRISGALRARFRFALRSPIDRAADQAGADFVWFVATGVHFTDRPYMTVVWDLQHIVTPWFPEMSSRGMWDQREQSLGWFLRRAAVVVTGTERGREELARHYQLEPNRVVILPHPTPRFALDPAEETDGAALERWGVTRPFLFYPAQFWAHKNHVNLLMALQELREKHGQNVDLVLVGSDKGNCAHVKQVAHELGIASSVHFLGFVSRSELVLLYQKASALAYVSWCGPENLPPLEAFALGCPVVATRIPGAEEQFGDAAELCDPGDPSDIARAMARVLCNSDRRSDLVKRGQQRAVRWTSREYVEGVFKKLDEFEPIVRNWAPSPKGSAWR